ncbi:conserved hypothetical protein [Rippkaea orientalis PCC 8801]|uniref:Glycosyltransferase RgtA/B/C/D-like domain-containing protein n=1 Tax=Rippkaea orientalis (strain PCC 8801 / RF-1) TaxID=41431 RepID=B7K1I4_RIPO1|nr:glycosyltransferase family 39 protein [Rippkaea orientalis]ACK67526.1 conserved hypothetical protein [Rippkaea orientalis PCC 8801]
MKKYFINGINSIYKTHIFLIIIALILGLFFRVVNIDKKVYWNDEADTLLRLSVHEYTEIFQQFFNDKIITVKEIQQTYQNVNSERTLIDMFDSLSKDAHPPLYFILSRWWFQIFSPWMTPITTIRSFSVFISLLVFPAVYWLCLELFNSAFVSAIALAIVAVSPIHVLYAQEARMYSLWTLLIVLSSAALLRAMRLNNKSNWIIYSLTLTVNFYTYLFSALVTLGQGIYVIILEKFRLSKRLLSYLAACLLGCLLYVPWLLVLFANYNNFKTITSWVEGGQSGLFFLLTTIFNNISNSFIDFWFVYSYFPNLNLPNIRFGLFIKPLLFLMIAYSIYFLCRHTEKRTWLFILTLIGTTPLLLLLKDITGNSGVTTQARYLIPCYLGLQLSLAYLLSYIPINPWQNRLWRVMTIFLLSGGILSISLSSQANTWANKYHNNSHEVAHVINQSSNSLVISDTHPAIVLSLAHYLKPTVSLELLKSSQSPQIPSNKQTIFLFNPSQQLRENIKKLNTFQVRRVKGIRNLWILQ